MREDVCMACAGHGEIVLPEYQRQPDGTVLLIYVTYTCTDCNGSGIKFVWSED